MKNSKKILALILALVMVMSMITGCQNAEDAPEVSEPESVNTPVNEPETSEDVTDEREHVELVMYNFYSTEFPGQKETNDAVNAYLKEKLNTTIDWHLLPFVEYASTTSTHLNAGGDADIISVGAYSLPFPAFARKNAFYPLDDLVDDYLSGTKSLLPDVAWDSMMVDGQLYGVPVPRDAATQYGLIFNDTMMQDLGLSYPEHYSSLYDIVDLLYEAKAARDAKYPEKKDQPIIKKFYNGLQAFYSVDILDENYLAFKNVPGGRGFESVGDEAFCPFLTEEYREYAKLRNQLVKDGIVAYDSSTYDPDGVMAQNGEFLLNITMGILFVDEDANMPYYKNKIVLSEEPVVLTSGFQNGYAIGRNCKYPERALEVIELLNTDPYLATLIRFGPEGIGWTDADNDGVIEPGAVNADPASKYMWGWYSWNMGGLTASKVPTGYPADFGDTLNELNSNALPAADFGFIFDNSAVINEVAACTNVVNEYSPTINKGQVDDYDKLVDEFVQKLKDNGIDKVIDELNRQIEEWNAAK